MFNWFKRPKEDNIKVSINKGEIKLDFDIADLNSFSILLNGVVSGDLNKSIMVNVLKTLHEQGHTGAMNELISKLKLQDGPIINPGECFTEKGELDE